MSVAVVTQCPKCQATMHRNWPACLVCQTPVERLAPPPLSPKGDETLHTETSARYVKTTHGRYAQPLKRDLGHLGPILPACRVCGALQYWHNHATDVWECWTCMPPHGQFFEKGKDAA